MANEFLTPQIIAREALMVLENNLIMANLIHRDYSGEFANVGDTVTARKPAKFVAHNFTGKIIIQDAVEGAVPVKLDRHRDVSFAVTSKQMTLDIKSFSGQLITPAVSAICQSVDEDILNEVANITNSVAGTVDAKDLSDIAKISKKLDINKVPMQQRRLVLNPEHKYRYALTDNLSKVAYAGTGDTLRNSELGKVYTLDTYMDQNAPYSMAETSGNAKTLKVTGTKDAKSVSLSGITAATATIKKGDGFILNGRMYRAAEDKTATAGAIESLTIDMPLLEDYTAVDAYIINQVHSLGFHRNAIAMVTRPIALPMGNKNAAIMEHNGLGVRVVFDYDVNTKTDTVSLDILYGIKTLDQNMAVKLVG